jgi:hypothetical protein
MVKHMSIICQRRSRKLQTRNRSNYVGRRPRKVLLQPRRDGRTAGHSSQPKQVYYAWYRCNRTEPESMNFMLAGDKKVISQELLA